MRKRNRFHYAVSMTVFVSLLVLLSLLTHSAAAFPFFATYRASLSDPGPYKAGYRTVTITRPDNTTFQAMLYYPATTEGQDTAFDGSGGRYPAITFGHGAISTDSNYRSTLSHLASYGYFVIATNSWSELRSMDDPIPADQFALDMRYCLTYLEQQNNTNTSTFYHMVRENAFGASGHSAGGAAAIIAGSLDTRIKALGLLAPQANSVPAALNAMDDVDVPVRILAGSCDGTTPVADHQQPLYNNANLPKQLVVFTGGYHNGFSNALFEFPAENCPSGVTKLTRDQQLVKTRQWLTAWFNYYLKGDSSLYQTVWGSGLTADPLAVVQSQGGGQAPATPTVTSTATAIPTPVNTPVPPPGGWKFWLFLPFQR